MSAIANHQKEMKKSLPDGWRWVKLGEVCEKSTGIRDPHVEPDKSFQYVDITSVNSILKCIIGTRSILGKDAPSRARQVIRVNDVIVATTRPNLNAVAQVPLELDDQICSTGFCVLRAGKDIFPDYLFAFVRHESFVEALSDLVKGALYPAVNDSQVKSQSIPLPPLPEQKRIAATLKDQMAAVDKARAAAQQRLEAVKTLPAAFLRQVFSDFFTKTWPRLPFGQVAVLQRGHDLPERDRKAGKYPVVTSSGIVGMHCEFRAKKPGVVTGRSGSVGRVHYIDSDFWPHNTALYVKDFLGNNPLFIYFLLQWINVKSVSSGTGVPTLDRKEVHKIVVSCPPITEQQRIAAILTEQISDVDKARVAAEAELETINALPAALLRRAFNGEL